MTRSLFDPLVTTLIAIAIALPASAVPDNYWTNATGDGSVMTPGNWSLNHVPAFGENAVINSGTQLIMQSNHFLTANTITCSIPFYVNGGTITCGSFTTNSTLSTFGNAKLYVVSLLQIQGTWNMFDSVASHFDLSPTELRIESGGQLVLWDGVKKIAMKIVNYGLIFGQHQSIIVGRRSYNAESENHGEIVDLSLMQSTDPNDRDHYFRNYGIMYFNGGTPRLGGYFDQRGGVDVDGGQLTIDHLLTMNVNYDIGLGDWVVRNGGYVETFGGNLKKISELATIRLENGGQFAGLHSLNSIDGRLELYQTTLQVTPAVTGVLSLKGFLRMEDGGRIEVQGGFDIPSPDAVFDKLVRYPNAYDVVVCQGSSNLGGQLIVECQNANYVPAGSVIPLVTDVGDCCNIAGVFDSELVFGANNPAHVDYQAHMTRLIVGEPNVCVGDLDGDGVVSLSDLAILLSNYGTVGSATANDGDLDGDLDVDLTDLSTLLSRFGATCS